MKEAVFEYISLYHLASQKHYIILSLVVSAPMNDKSRTVQ